MNCFSDALVITVRAMAQLSVSYLKLERPEEGILLLENALEGAKLAVGEDHRFTGDLNIYVVKNLRVDL